MKISRTNETTRTRPVPPFPKVLSKFQILFTEIFDAKRQRPDYRLYRVENPKRLPNTRSN